jgi:Xaa-Pro aminopeptidase
LARRAAGENGMSDKLNALRAWMKQDNSDILLFPHNDMFQSEYQPPHEERLAWLTGFTGSWGFAIVTADAAHLFVDGRYTLQAPQQVDTNHWTIHEISQLRPTQWLDKNLQNDQTVAVEGWRFTVNGLQQMQTILTRKKASLRLLEGDLADFLWTDRPAAPNASAFALSIDYAGRSTSDKLADLQKFMQDNNLDGYLITDPGHVCWLLNIRGHDIAHMPIILSMAFVRTDGTILLFADTQKISSDLRDTLGSTVIIYNFSELQYTLTSQPAKVIGLDPNHAPALLSSALKDAGKEIIHHASPLELSRAIKNPTEIGGSRRAHRRDGVAVIETLHWLQTHGDATVLTEKDVADKLLERRSAQDLFVEPSFETIPGSGAHGAIVHYHVTLETNQNLQNNTLLLIDSGGQYFDGTTDITRTIAIGTPSAEMIANYTSVLQGHIALTTARFPHNTTGATLDTLARAPLWQQGRNYNHGTGHGIGSFMATHEGPQGFSHKSPAPLHAGMFITIEPGYYKAGHYGIRLENVVLVTDVTQDSDEQPMLGFESLTLVPFESGLIDFTRLSATEKQWLHDYHQMVLDGIFPVVVGDLQGWLKAQCAKFLTSSS